MEILPIPIPKLFIITFHILCHARIGNSYDYLQMVLIYKPGFCSSMDLRGKVIQCNEAQATRIGDFSIHGIWPSNYNGPTLHDCPSNTPFNFYAIPRGKLYDMDNYWPDLLSSGSNLRFWEHEWLAHGTCSEAVFNQGTYFSLTVSIGKHLIDTLTIQNVHGAGASILRIDMETTLINSLGTRPKLRCLQNSSGKNDLQLSEIVICFDNAILPRQVGCIKDSADNCPKVLLF